MGRPGVTEEEVYEAIQMLKERALNPTVMSVREILGTGSATTIQRHLHSFNELKVPLVKHKQNKTYGEGYKDGKAYAIREMRSELLAFLKDLEDEAVRIK